MTKRREVKLFRIENKWRATVLLPQMWASLPGVLGANGPDGPFAEGGGNSPEQALEDLMIHLGRIALAHLTAAPS
jgi:hypothetical protein